MKHHNPLTKNYMASEITKKDLADLEKRLDAKLQAIIDSTNTALAQETDSINKAIQWTNKGFADVTKRVNDLEKRG